MIPIAGMTCFCWQDIYVGEKKNKKENENHDSKAQRDKDRNAHVLFTVPAFRLVVCISGEVIPVSKV